MINNIIYIFIVLYAICTRLQKVSNFWDHKVGIPILVNYYTTVLVLGTPNNKVYNMDARCTCIMHTVDMTLRVYKMYTDIKL